MRSMQEIYWIGFPPTPTPPLRTPNTLSMSVHKLQQQGAITLFSESLIIENTSTN